MSTLPGCLIFFVFIIITKSGTNDAKQNKLSDLDELRVSNNQLSGHLNYHSITPDNDPPIVQITNQIGKPLVPIVDSQFSTSRHSQQLQLQQQHHQQQAGAAFHESQWRRLPSRKSVTGPGVRAKLAQEEICKWMTLKMFQDKSLEPNELIIRDDAGQPCYILTMTAYIKSSEDNYFLLSNLKSLPHMNKVKFDSQTPDGSSNEHHSPLNCSAMASGSGVGTNEATSLFLPIQRPNRPFREEITIVADCGYLVLNTHVDGSFLTLETISFYQNPDSSSQLPITKLRKGAGAPSLDTQNRSEYLIFTTDGTENSPLFTLPSISRYTCQNRIRLTGNNSVQLILERFELQRLATYPVAKEFTNSTLKLLASETKFDSSENEESNINDGRFIARTKRTPEQAHDKQQQRQPHFLALRNSVISVTRCPDPVHLLEPLTTMVGANQKRNNYTTKMVRAAKRELTKNSAAGRFDGLNLVILNIVCLIVALRLPYFFSADRFSQSHN